MNEVASLVIAVDSSGADRATRSLDNLEKGAKRTERASDGLRRAWTVAGAAAAAFGAAAGTALAVTAAWTRDVVRLGTELNRFSQVANSSVGEFQRWAVGAQSVGLSQEKLADQLKDFNEKVGEFQQTGGGGMKDFFEQVAPKIGITAEAFRGLSGTQGLQLYFNSLERANLSQQEMSFFLESMASDTTALIPLLRNGGKGFADWAREAERFGAVMSDDVATAVDGAQRASQRLDLAMQGVKLRVVQEVLPALEGFADLLGEDQTQRAIRDVSELLGQGAAAAVGFASEIRDATRWIAELSGKMDGLTGVSLPEWLKVAMKLATNNPAGAIGEFAKARATSPDAPAPRASEGIDFTLPAPGPSVFGGAAAIKEKTAATRELTAAQKAWQKMEAEIAAHEEVATAALRDATNARLQKIIDEEDATERQRQATAALIADMEFERSLIGMTNAEREKAVALRWAGANATDEQRAHIAALVDDMEELREAQAVVDDIKFATVDFAVSAAMNMSRAGDAFEQFGDRMKRIALQLLAEKAVQWLFGMFGASSYSSWGQANGIGAPVQVGGTTYGGARAAGGPVTAGSSYIVGDGGGPELFTPTQNGRVTPITTAQKGNNTYVTVENHGGNPARVERSTGPNGDQFVKVIIDQAKGAVTEDILRGGSTSRAMQSAFGLQRQGVPVSG